MKFRSDFVTNSSSSSYIIGKKDDARTVQDVYAAIRAVYLEYLKKVDKAVAYITEHPEYGVTTKEYKDDDREEAECFGFETVRDYDDWQEFKKVQGQFEDDFGLPFYTLINPLDHEWVTLETYDEYVNFWKQFKAEEKNIHRRGPFTIFSLEDGKVGYWVSESRETIESEWGKHYRDGKEEVGVNSWLLNWYFQDFEHAYNHPDNCRSCDARKYCRRNSKKNCLKMKETIKNEHFQPERACLHFLGKICVLSESGLIPESVVDGLYEMSEYACEHMG